MKIKVLLQIILLLILWESAVFAQQPYLVKDINPGLYTSVSNYFTNVNGTLFFSGYTPANGLELWKSDGTEAGTVMVKDIQPGSGSSVPSFLVDVNGVVFFQANDGINGAELWKSDGTEAGTVMVKNINSGTAGSDPFKLTNINGVLFFIANDGNSGPELWKSDGTSAGTVLVKDIEQGPKTSYATWFTKFDNKLFFTASNEIFGNELWRSDGTEAGTFKITEFPGLLTGPTSYPFLTDVNGTLYFKANNTGLPGGSKLWKSDGTTAGTTLVKDINPNSVNSTLWGLTNVNGVLFFSADDGVNGTELWKSDGTEAGTVMVKDIRPGTFGSNPTGFTNFNGILLFSATGVTSELWKSDGTETGTILVKENSGIGGSVIMDNFVYFVANDGIIGLELFKTDGTSDSTIGFDIKPGTGSSSPSHLTRVDSILFFKANGDQLWAVKMKKSTNPPTVTSSKNNLLPSGFVVYPNPGNGVFSVYAKQNNISTIEIYNLKGEIIYSNINIYKQESIMIDISNFSKGIYLMKIFDGKNNYTEKIVIL
jgi:trimeric autotransporter adhesin